MKIKKIVPVILLATTLVACGNKKDEEVKPAETETVAPAEEIEEQKGAEDEKVTDESTNEETTPGEDAETVPEEDEEVIEETNWVKDFVVEEVNEDGVILSSAAEGEENDRYMVTKEELGLDEVNVGEQLKIEWDGVIKTSDPAQFGQIIKAEKILTAQ